MNLPPFLQSKIPAAGLWVVAAVISLTWTGVADADRTLGCAVVTEEHPLTFANRGEAAGLGKSLVQVFEARDTVVTAVTVWVNGLPNPGTTGMHLFIVGCDTSLTPDLRNIFLDGPVAHMPNFAGGPAELLAVSDLASCASFQEGHASPGIHQPHVLDRTAHHRKIEDPRS